MLKGLPYVIPLLAAPSLLAQATCGSLQLTPDYSFAIGASSGGSAYSFTLGGQILSQGPMPQLALFHFDNSLNSSFGTAPAQSNGTSFVPGKFGTAVTVAPGGALSYPQAGNLSFADGTVEMWVSPQYDGGSAIYTGNEGTPQAQVLFDSFWGAGELVLAIANHGGGPYFYVGAAGVYAGYPQVSGITGWKSGEWHHLAFTYSAALGRLRLYVDGTLAQENDANISFPAASPNTFTIAGDAFGDQSAFAVDEVRITKNEMPAGAIAYDASRSGPFADDEVYLSLSAVSPGQLNYTVSGCGSIMYAYTGVPIIGFTPPNGLLSAGSTSVSVAFNTIQPTTCGYSVGSAADYASMHPLDGSATATHQGVVNGLSFDPRKVNQVFFRCASNPDYLESHTYRSVAAPGGPFPRIGNIWIGEYLYTNAPQNAQNNQLFLGAGGLSAAQVLQLRASNSNVLNIPAVNVADNGGEGNPPDSYYLKDVNGNKIVDWCSPPRYLLNVTNPKVQQFLGQFAYQQLSQSNFVSDGVFLDSFGTTISQPFTDCLGNTVKIDSNGDGVADDPAVLNAAWSAGEYAVVSAFRSLAPGAYVSGHVLEAPAQPQSLAGFNGTSLEFYPQSVREGQTPFAQLWDLYQAWESQSVAPAITMVQACPPNQLSYGYGYHPLNALLPSTIAFAQSFYPNMRFGLGLTLMGNGYFGFDFGDEAPPVNWWYDEYNFNLGYPLSAAAQIGTGAAPNLLMNGGFESGLTGWQLNVVNDGQGKATVTPDNSIVAVGTGAAHLDIISPGTVNWHVMFEQDNLPLTARTEYQVQFWARADTPRTITVFSQGGPPNFTNYGLFAQIAIGTGWSLYSAPFTATATANDARLEFWVGDVAGNVWLDGVALSVAPPQVYRRDFSNGIVLLNGEGTPRTVTLESGFQRFMGTQAPLYQYIVDDSDSGFSDTGSWNTVAYNTGAYSGAGSGPNLPAEPQNQNGPYYHCWNGACHELDSGSGQAQWNLYLPADGQYSIQVWLPAAPNAANWTKNAVYEVVAAGNVVATATIDQTTAAAGDGWHMVATVNLSARDALFLTVHNAGAGVLIADAVYVTSTALYNDGSPAAQVTLGAFDAILLQREQPALIPVTVQTNPTGLSFTVDGGAPVVAPQTINLTAGGHVLAVGSPQAGTAGVQYTFGSWSDGGAAAHSISVMGSGGSFTAAFQTQYQLNLTANPGPGGVLAPSSGIYFNAGKIATVSAVANSPYYFDSWSGGAVGNTNPLFIAMNGPVSITATFTVPGFTCNLTGDNSPQVSDVQLIVNEALGLAPPAHDLNRDNMLNVADIQKEIQAAIGVGCIY